ncbi:hypothetical protein RRSWK_02749 [Rhodopirellula sp. SWK7]|nr:hypothetical protein RRSWK_02749 [Rhodopirellula sp. SWK7]
MSLVTFGIPVNSNQPANLSRNRKLDEIFLMPAKHAKFRSETAIPAD